MPHACFRSQRVLKMVRCSDSQLARKQGNSGGQPGGSVRESRQPEAAEKLAGSVPLQTLIPAPWGRPPYRHPLYQPKSSAQQPGSIPHLCLRGPPALL